MGTTDSVDSVRLIGTDFTTHSHCNASLCRMIGWEDDNEDLFVKLKKMRDEEEENGDLFSLGVREVRKKKKTPKPYYSRSPPKVKRSPKRRNRRRPRNQRFNSLNDLTKIYTNDLPPKKPFRPVLKQRPTSVTGTKKLRSSFHNSLKNKKSKMRKMKKFSQRIEFLEKKLRDKKIQHRKEVSISQKEKKQKDTRMREMEKEKEGLKEEISKLKQKIYRKNKQMNLFFKSKKDVQSPNSSSISLPSIQKRDPQKKKLRCNVGNEDSELEGNKLSQLRNIIEFQKNEKKKLIFSLKRTKGKVSRFKTRESNLRATLEKKDEDLRNTIGLNQKLRERNDDLTTQNRQLLKKLGELENELAMYKKTSHSCDMKIESLNESLRKANVHINSLEGERIRLGEENESLRINFSEEFY